MKHWTEMGRRVAAMLLLALVVASCEQAPAPTEVGEPQELLGILDPITETLDATVDGIIAPTPKTVQAVDENGRIRDYVLVQEPVLSLDLANMRVSKLIGVNGGTLSLLGHEIVVPAGAVDVPALFTLLVMPTGYVHVDITAVAGDLLSLLDIGGAGFDEPVRLQLTYSRATNVENPRRLVILRMNTHGLGEVHEALPSEVNRRSETVTVWLDHFSGYCMAM